MNKIDPTMKWQVVYTHTEMGKWVTRIGATFTNKREAQWYIRECKEQGENLSLRRREE